MCLKHRCDIFTKFGFIFVALLVFLPECVYECLALLFGCFPFEVTKEKAAKAFCTAIFFLKEMLLS